MIELCRTEGQKLLFEGKYDRVVPAALESLKFSIEVYGLSSIELVPSYLILGEASIGKYKYIWPSSCWWNQANMFVIQTVWGTDCVVWCLHHWLCKKVWQKLLNIAIEHLTFCVNCNAHAIVIWRSYSLAKLTSLDFTFVPSCLQ